MVFGFLAPLLSAAVPLIQTAAIGTGLKAAGGLFNWLQPKLRQGVGSGFKWLSKVTGLGKPEVAQRLGETVGDVVTKPIGFVGEALGSAAGVEETAVKQGMVTNLMEKINMRKRKMEGGPFVPSSNKRAWGGGGNIANQVYEHANENLIFNEK